MQALSLKPGDTLESALFAGLTTTPDGQHCAVVLLPDEPADKLTWQQAIDWATGLNATLPTRSVSALLYANLGSQFKREWHWTSETDEDDGSCAWGQDFDDGYQDYPNKSWKGRARAVRLVQLTA